MFNEDNRGEEIASIILPSSMEIKSSPTRCYIDAITGKPRQASTKATWFKPATVFEVLDEEYRRKAKENAELIGELSLFPFAQFSLADRLDAWCKLVSPYQCRVFFGGDAAIRDNRNAVMSIAACAKKNPDKLIYSRTSSMKCLESIATMEITHEMTLPENMLLYAEDMGQVEDIEESLTAMDSSCPVIRYEPEGECDLTFFPESDDDIVMKRPKCCHISK